MKHRNHRIADAGRRMRIALAVFAAGLASPAVGEIAAGQDGIRSIAVVGTAFRVTTDEGRLLAQDDLIGAVLTIGDGNGGQLPLRIDGVEPDPRNPDGEILLYSMSMQDAATGEWRNVCDADIEGRRMGFPLAGTWTPDGRHVPSDTEFSITCTGGAQGKCVRFGYRPWARLPDGSSLWDHHQACTRMIRADYCGDGNPHTRNGTPIVIYDRHAIQSDEQAPGMSFEAAWGPDGALCVSHTRIPDILSMDGLGAICPGVKRERAAAACDAHPAALILNRSAQAPSMQAARK